MEYCKQCGNCIKCCKKGLVCDHIPIHSNPKLYPRISREDFRSILCEYMPSISEDSGLPEWTQGELDKVYDDLILGKGVWSKINGRDDL